MAKRKVKWKEGDVFLVHRRDNRFSIGQVVAHEPEALNSVSIILFDSTIDSEAQVEAFDFNPQKVFSALLATRDLLDSGSWKIVANRPILWSKSRFKHEELRPNGFVGAKIIGAGILTEFVNAFHGLCAWDDWKEPNYLDSLLISSEKKPKHLVFKNVSQT